MTLAKLITVILTLLALFTMFPYSGASHVNLLGYKSISTLSPITTGILFIGALAVRYYSIEFIYKRAKMPLKDVSKKPTKANPKKKHSKG
jgi:hypothetical protein